MLFAAEARTAFACTSTSLNVYADSSYVYADAFVSTGQCGVNCYEWIDLILTGPSNQSVEQIVDNGDNGRQVSVQEVVSLPIEPGRWVADATYSTDNTYYQSQVFYAPAVPSYMLVQGDQTGLCTVCSSTASRSVTLKVMKNDNTNAGQIAICETVTNSSWSCTQSQPTPDTIACTGYPASTAADGTFTDNWSLNSDSYIPVGCGFDGTNVLWQHPQISGPPMPIGTLKGYIHTDHISINGVVSPDKLPANTKVTP
jgi:hypothetical protein